MMESTSVPAEARQLLDRFTDETRRLQCADDLLVFLYALRDRAVIVDSRNSVLKARSFHALGDLIYGLEARPDETITDPDQRHFIQTLLKDLASGALVVRRTS